MFTKGNVPYPELNGYDVLEFIKSGKRLPKPKGSINNIYELMLNCFQLNPDSRPTFEQIIEQIEFIIESEGNELNKNVISNEINYVVKQLVQIIDESYLN